MKFYFGINEKMPKRDEPMIGPLSVASGVDSYGYWIDIYVEKIDGPYRWYYLSRILYSSIK